MSFEGESNLVTLLRNLSPVLAGQWVFAVASDARAFAHLDPLMSFREAEGVTAIVRIDQAEGLDVRFEATRIDLNVHSSLNAVGMTAAVSQALAERGIPTNIVAAAHHDYLFVPTPQAEIAMKVLVELTDPVQIRRASIADVSILAPLFDGYRVFYKQPSDLVGARRFLEARFRSSESVVFIAEIGGEAIGFTQLYPTFSSISMKRMWILNDIFVDPSTRKLGVGTKLLDKSCEFAESDGAVSLKLCTAIDNFTAQKLYEATGWKRIDRFYHYKFDLEQGPL